MKMLSFCSCPVSRHLDEFHVQLRSLDLIRHPIVRCSSLTSHGPQQQLGQTNLVLYFVLLQCNSMPMYHMEWRVVEISCFLESNDFLLIYGNNFDCVLFYDSVSRSIIIFQNQSRMESQKEYCIILSLECCTIL